MLLLSCKSAGERFKSLSPSKEDGRLDCGSPAGAPTGLAGWSRVVQQERGLASARCLIVEQFAQFLPSLHPGISVGIELARMTMG